MKIKFYYKDTYITCYWQGIYLVDMHGSVFEDTDDGLKLQDNIGWRVV